MGTRWAHTFYLDLTVEGSFPVKHVYPEVERSPEIRYRQPRLLYWNIGGRFKDVTASSGPALKELRSSRGSAVGDLDNDGSLEIVISNMGERPTLLKNFAPRKGWLLVQCIGRSDTSDGARARVQVAARLQRRFSAAPAICHKAIRGCTSD